MKILVFGSGGQLGEAFVRYFKQEGISCQALDHKGCDITSVDSLRAVIEDVRPDLIINCAAYNLVDAAEDNSSLAFAVNGDAPRLIAGICAERKIRMVHFSTDYVFDGRKGAPYVEGDLTGPLNVYGASKLEGEKAVLQASADHLVFRTSWVFGRGVRNFLHNIDQWAQKSDTLKIAEDEISVPTFTDTIVKTSYRALKTGLKGLYHLTNSGQASRYELTVAYLKAKGIKGKTVIPVPRLSFGLKTKRPGYSVMSSSLLGKTLGLDIPRWEEDLEFFAAQSL